jgi:hypothetical protein
VVANESAVVYQSCLNAVDTKSICVVQIYFVLCG